MIGHRQIDPTHAYIDATEQSVLSASINNGTGLVNFDNDLWSNGSARYQFIQDIFNFSSGGATSGSGVTIADATHYVTNRHVAAESIPTSAMTLAGITLPPSGQALAVSTGQPIVAITTHGAGRALQWGSYDWMSYTCSALYMG